MNWDSLFATRTQQMKRSTVREILKLTARAEVISFAGGLPAPELFPVERIRQATDTVLAERGQEVLQYSTTEGMPELRELIARRLSSGCGGGTAARAGHRTACRRSDDCAREEQRRVDAAVAALGRAR